MSNIKSIRLALGYTQQRFAEGMGCTQSAVGQWERGESSPSVDVGKRIVQLATTAGECVSLDHIYGLRDWKPMSALSVSSQPSA